MNTFTDLMVDGTERIASRAHAAGLPRTLRIEGTDATLTLFVPAGDTGVDWLDRLAGEAQSLAAKIRTAGQVSA